MSGIFISKGMAITIPIGGLRLSINSDGSPQADVKVQVIFDVCPSWLEIALEHLKAAHTCNTARTEAWKNDNASARGRSLESEFKASMQAMVASAIAIDSFYATVQSKLKIDKALITKWRKNKTPRYSQVAELLRIAFQLKPKGVKVLRDYLKQIYHFRDQAVHPSSEAKEAILHPEIKVGVEWRFVTFRYENALPLVYAAVQIISQLVSTDKLLNEKLRNHANYLKPQIESFLADPLFVTYAASASKPKT